MAQWLRDAPAAGAFDTLELAGGDFEPGDLGLQRRNLGSQLGQDLPDRLWTTGYAVRVGEVAGQDAVGQLCFRVGVEMRLWLGVGHSGQGTRIGLADSMDLTPVRTNSTPLAG